MVAKARTIHRFDAPGHGRYPDTLVRRRVLAVWVTLGGSAVLAAAVTAGAQELPPPDDPALEAPAQAPAETAAVDSAADGMLDEAVSPTPGASTMSLAQAVATALQGNFTMQDATDSVSSARYRYSASMAQFYPKLTPRVARSSEQSLMGFDASQAVPWTGGTVTASANYRMLENADGPFSRASTMSFLLSQPLLRGFGPNASMFELRNSRRDREGRERSHELERQRLAVDVARAFYQVVEQRALLAVARQSLERMLKLQRASEARLEVGLVSKLDVYRAQLQASQAQEAMVRSEAALQDALERFRFLLGLDAGAPVEPAAVALSPELPPAGPDPLPVLLQRALAQRLDLIETRDQVSDARRSASLAKQNLLPQLDLNVGLSKEGFGTSFSSAWNAGDQRVNLFFSASYPLERSSDLLNKAQADLSLTGTQRHLRQREMEIESQVRAAVRELDRMRKSVELQKQGVDVARQQLRLATLRYQRGLTSNFDVVDAESSLVLARSALVGLLARYQVARVELLRVTGTLDVEREFLP
jgi:outer membrane protein TolC